LTPGIGLSIGGLTARMRLSNGSPIIFFVRYLRAMETVSPLADLLKKDIIEYEELRERPIASLKYEVPEEELLNGIQRSFVDVDFCMPEGETTRQAQERAIPVIKRLLSEYRGKKIVIGTHGNIMTIILHYFDRTFGFEFWTSL